MTDMRPMQSDGLALEYQGYYGTARGSLEVSDLVNNPTANRKCSILGLGLSEEFWNRRLAKFGPLFENRAYTAMIAQNVVQHLPNVLFLQSNVLVGHIEADAVKHEG